MDTLIHTNMEQYGNAKETEGNTNNHSQLSQANRPKCQNLLTMPIEIEMIKEETFQRWREISADANWMER